MRALEKTLVSCLAHDVLHLIVLPTEACTYRCSYCYEDFRPGRMERRVVRGIKNLLTDRAEELRQVTLSWLGGEPLLARDVIEDVLGHAQILRAKHPSLRVRSDVTTNGHHLDRAVFERLVALGADRYQVAFDVPPGWHDRVRRLLGGGATFERIWSNLTSLRGVARDFEVRVRVHVDRENQDAMPAFIERYAEAFGMDERFALYIRELARCGGPNDAELAVFDDPAECRSVLTSLRDQALRRGVRSAEPRDAGICHATQTNSFVVRADGRVNKCSVVLDHPRNQVGRLHESGRLELAGDRMWYWMKGRAYGDSLGGICPMRDCSDDAPDSSPPA
jgi:uncharacterized protein